MTARSASNGRQLVAVFVIALLVRLAFLGWLWSGWHTEPQSGMSLEYFRQGYGIAAGYGLISWPGEAGRELKRLYARVDSAHEVINPASAPPLAARDVHYSTLHPPGMALLVAAVHRTLRIPADVPVELIGVLLDSAAAVLLAWLVGQLLAPDIGFGTGLVYAFFLPAAHAASSRAPEGMMALFIVGAVACWWKALLDERGAGWWRWSALSGVILGVACYLRPDYLLLPIALAVASWVMVRRLARPLKLAVVAQVVCFVVLLPWAYRNHALTGRWLFTGSSVGPTLITGLAEYRNPWGYGVSDLDRQRQADAQHIDDWTSSEADIYFRHLFLQSVTSDPLGYVIAVAKRVPLALAPPLSLGLDNPYRHLSFAMRRQSSGMDRYQAIGSAPFLILLGYWDLLAMSVVALAALLAWGYLLHRERALWRQVFFLFTPHGYALGSHLLTHFESRFLLPSMGFLLISLGYLVALLMRRLRRDSGTRAAGGQLRSPGFAAPVPPVPT